MAVLLALMSSLVWGTADFFGGMFTRRIDPIKTVVVSQAGGLIVTLVALCVALPLGHGPTGSGFLLWAVLSGAVGCLGLASFYAALGRGTMGVVSPIASLGALVPVLLGLIEGDHVTVLVGIGMALALAGVVLASGPELSGRVSRTPVLLAILAALCFGLSLFFLHRASRDGVVPSLAAMRVASVAVLGSVWFVRRSRMPRGDVRRPDVLPLMLTGCGDLAANALFGVASTLGMVSLVAMLGSLYPVATILLARVVLHERLGRVQWLGVVLALAGVVLVTT